MKIHSVSSLSFQKNNNIENNSVAKNPNKTANNTVTNLNLMPNYSYLLKFGANNDNLETLYNSYSNGKGMPYTYEQVLSKMTPAERRNITDVYANYKSVYAKMEDCHTVEDLKKEFPAEFKNIQSALTQKDSNGSFLTKLNNWAKLFEESGDYLFPKTKDNDFSVYLAKKVYFEAKTKKEILEDFSKDLNNEILTPEDINSIKSARSEQTENELIPTSIYKKLGLIGDLNSNGFRHSLSTSRQEYIDKYGSIYRTIRHANFKQNVSDILDINSTSVVNLPKKNSPNYEKAQYAMFYVWNNSLELRRTLSDFLLKNSAGDSLLNPDFVKLKYSQPQKSEKESQHSLMVRFWAENPQLKDDFAKKCSEAFDIIEKAIDNGSFNTLKKQIDKDRQDIYLLLKEEKAQKEYELLKADLRQQETDARIKKEKIEEEARIKRENQIKEMIKNDFTKSEFVKTIPKSLHMHFIRKFQEIGLSSANVEEYNKKAKVYIDKIDTAIATSLSDTFFKIIEQPLNKTGQSADNSSAKKKFVRKLVEKYVLINGTVKNEAEKQNNMAEISETLASTTRIFLTRIFLNYITGLNIAPTKEIGRAERKKMLNNIYTDFRKIFPFNQNDNKSKIEDFAIKEYMRMVVDKTPEQILREYTRTFKSQMGI